MILLLSLGFGLGVLAVVLAAEYERRKKPIAVVFGSAFADSSPRARTERAREIVARFQESTPYYAEYQDSTLPAKDK